MPDTRAARYVAVVVPAPIDGAGCPLDTDDPFVRTALHRRVDELDGPALDGAVAAARAAGLDADTDGRELLHRAVDVVIPWNRLVYTLTLDGRAHLVTGLTGVDAVDVEEPGLLAALATAAITAEPLPEFEGRDTPRGERVGLRPLAAWLAGLVTVAAGTGLAGDLIEDLAEAERFGTDAGDPLGSLGSLFHRRVD
jgi:hypothetical protein